MWIGLEAILDKFERFFVQKISKNNYHILVGIFYGVVYDLEGYCA